MATLSGVVTKNKTVSLEIKLIPPSLDGRRDAYTVKFMHENVLTFEKTYDVHGWILGHYWMYCLARAFKNIDKLVDRQLGFSLSQSDEDDEYQGYLSPAYLEVGLDWLKTILWGRTESGVEKVYAEFFIQENADDDLVPNSLTAIFIRKYIITTPLEAIKFGEEFERELKEAEELRYKLGIPANEE